MWLQIVIQKYCFIAVITSYSIHYTKLYEVGNEPILGKPCEIWEGSGVKFWFWKYLTLKSEITIAGQTMVLTATSVKTDVPIAASEWVLPTNVVFKEVDLENPDVEVV